MFPCTKQKLAQQRLAFFAKDYPVSSLYCFRKPASRVARGRPENLARSPGWGPAPSQPPTLRAPLGRIRGAARRLGGLRPSDLPTFFARPGAPACEARVHAYLLCSGETHFPRAQEEGPTALAIRPSPRPCRSPPRRAPAPSTRTPNPSTCSCSRGPNFLHLLAAATTPRTPKQLNSRCRPPGCVSSPPAGSPDTAPSRPEPPSLLGFPTAHPRRPLTTQRPSQPSHSIGYTVRQDSTGTRRRRRLRDSGAGGARAGRGRKARSLECGGSQRLGARPAPHRRSEAPPAGRRAIERPLWQA